MRAQELYYISIARNIHQNFQLTQTFLSLFLNLNKLDVCFLNQTLCASNVNEEFHIFHISDY